MPEGLAPLWKKICNRFVRRAVSRTQLFTHLCTYVLSVARTCTCLRPLLSPSVRTYVRTEGESSPKGTGNKSRPHLLPRRGRVARTRIPSGNSHLLPRRGRGARTWLTFFPEGDVLRVRASRRGSKHNRSPKGTGNKSVPEGARFVRNDLCGSQVRG